MTPVTASCSFTRGLLRVTDSASRSQVNSGGNSPFQARIFLSNGGAVNPSNIDPRVWIVVAAVVVAVIVIAWFVGRKRRSAALQSRFGPEYARALRDKGDSAESELLERQRRVDKFSIRELSAAERERFVTDWRLVQSRFVDNPNGAVQDADQLVMHLMQARGYPMTNFEQRAADISVDHPRVVDNYRAAHEIAIRQERGQATTEDLRNAIIYYRSLFDELLSRPAHAREVA